MKFVTAAYACLAAAVLGTVYGVLILPGGYQPAVHKAVPSSMNPASNSAEHLSRIVRNSENSQSCCGTYNTDILRKGEKASNQCRNTVHRDVNNFKGPEKIKKIMPFFCEQLCMCRRLHMCNSTGYLKKDEFVKYAKDLYVEQEVRTTLLRNVDRCYSISNHGANQWMTQEPDTKICNGAAGMSEICFSKAMMKDCPDGYFKNTEECKKHRDKVLKKTFSDQF
ncbi:uncharacterized protein [Periplaneta americana]|uniref:uncharacterized protein n=1 Tax=Periplaneta americana TaxID=6978 RepID=UPI0037E7FCD0